MEPANVLFMQNTLAPIASLTLPDPRGEECGSYVFTAREGAADVRHTTDGYTLTLAGWENLSRFVSSVFAINLDREMAKSLTNGK